MQSPENQQPASASDASVTGRRDINDPNATFEDLPYKPQLTKSQAKRANQTFKGMVLSLLFTLAAVIPILLLNPINSGGENERSVDLEAVAAQAAPAADFEPWAPTLGEGEYANFARWQTSRVQEVSYWEFGLVMQERDFVWVRQISNAEFNPSWLAALTDNAVPTDTLILDGTEWEQRTKDEQVYLISEREDSTLVLSSDTSEEQLLSIAQAAQQQVK
ncbi:DUF4245 domain-containing protein [Glutamicibacter uratoxydans]|uniref:DUF4245 domain-containing protein n=1 Tax=Glutamicibacter uratoxydans TaxID=43667 RepID=UPI003D7002BC